MDWTILNVGSVTNAIRGKALLEKRGFSVRMQRSMHPEDTNGCGYTLQVNGNGEQAMALLKQAGLRVSKATNSGRGR